MTPSFNSTYLLEENDAWLAVGGSHCGVGLRVWKERILFVKVKVTLILKADSTLLSLSRDLGMQSSIYPVSTKPGE